jgi:hypothetical protein
MRAFIVCAVFTASSLFAGHADTNTVAGSFYRTVVSADTEQYATVDSQKEVVTLYDKADRVIWTTNVVTGLQSALVTGERKIHGMKVYRGYLYVNVGRGYGVVDIKTGDLNGFDPRL